MSIEPAEAYKAGELAALIYKGNIAQSSALASQFRAAPQLAEGAVRAAACMAEEGVREQSPDEMYRAAIAALKTFEKAGLMPEKNPSAHTALGQLADRAAQALAVPDAAAAPQKSEHQLSQLANLTRDVFGPGRRQRLDCCVSALETAALPAQVVFRVLSQHLNLVPMMSSTVFARMAELSDRSLALAVAHSRDPNIRHRAKTEMTSRCPAAAPA